MKLGQIEQQPEERRSYSINYSNYLDGDRVEQAEGIAEPAGLVVEAVGIYDDGQRVRFWVRGGQAGGSYKISITVRTVGGETLQDEVMAKIKEV
ncbi:MAG: hypothetical protein RR800_00615 [Comamonas sp.]